MRHHPYFSNTPAENLTPPPRGPAPGASHRCSSSMGQISVLDRTDGRVWQCSCGQWFVTRAEGSAPPGHRGQWSGWVNWPISARRARKLTKRAAA